MKKFVLLASCFFILCINLRSQSLFIPLDSCFMSFDSNRLVFPKGNTLSTFFRKLDKLFFEGEGNVNIMHIGGSHVQAGVFSHTIRMNLLSVYPTIVGNRGIVFPFSAAKTNNPFNYKTTYSGKWKAYRNVNREIPFPLGLNGMLVVSQEEEASITISMRNTNGQAFDFDRIRLLGYTDSNNVKPILHTAIGVNEGIYDSLSKSYVYDLPSYIDSFDVTFSKRDSVWEPFYLRGFILENQLPGISYHSVGVNGASVPSYLKCELFENDLSFIKPDLCIFAIGINDASGDTFDTVVFKQNYDALIQRILKVSPDCEFVFMSNNDSYKRHRRRYYNNTNGILAEQAFMQLAEKYHAGFWNLFRIMGGPESMKNWETNGYAQRDKVHFTTQGYKLLGDLFFNALIDAYLTYLKDNHIDYGHK